MKENVVILVRGGGGALKVPLFTVCPTPRSKQAATPRIKPDDVVNSIHIMLFNKGVHEVVYIVKINRVTKLSSQLHSPQTQPTAHSQGSMRTGIRL